MTDDPVSERLVVGGVQHWRLAALQTVVGPGKRLDLELSWTTCARCAEDGDALLDGRHEIVPAEDREEWTRDPLESRAWIMVEPAADELDLRVVTRALTRSKLAPAWQEASVVHTYHLLMTPDELEALQSALDQAIRPFISLTRGDAPEDAAQGPAARSCVPQRRGRVRSAESLSAPERCLVVQSAN